MSIELRLSFSGLTALVPRKNATEPKPAKEWIVVMPSLATGENLTKEVGVGNEVRRFPIQPHHAFLVVNDLAVRKSTTKEERLRVTHRESGRTNLLFPLEREALKIESGTAGLRVFENVAAGEVPKKTDPHERHDIRWVPLICIPFKKSHLNPVTLRPSESLAGVVLLDRGTLETVDVHRNVATNEPVLFEFRRGDGKVLWKQALANRFRLRVDVDQDEATLVLRDENGDSRLLVVGPYPGCLKNEKGYPIVEVQVFNRELEQILGFDLPPDLTTKGEDLADTDFAIFYWLSPVWDDLSADDVVLPYTKTGGGGADRKPCDPPTYTGFGD